jgi:general secretion pathway protein B
MSYILDALKKADHERSIGNVPDLDTPHWSRRRGSTLRYWVWGGIALLIANGALLAFLFSRDEGSETRPGVSAYTPQSGQPYRKPRARPETAPPPVVAARPQLVPDSLPLKPLARPEHTQITEPRQPLLPLEEPDTTVAEPRTQTAGTGAGQPAPAARTVVSRRTGTGTSKVPEWSELPLEFRAEFSPPRLDVHVYDDDPSRRFILIGLQRFVEGDTLESGAKLEKILPGSIQLYYQGTRFRIDR